MSTVVAERAELLGRADDHRERHELVAARACAPLPVLAELALPLLAVGGTLRGVEGSARRRRAELRRGSAAVSELGGGSCGSRPSGLAALGDHRFVVVREGAAHAGPLPATPRRAQAAGRSDEPSGRHRRAHAARGPVGHPCQSRRPRGGARRPAAGRRGLGPRRHRGLRAAAERGDRRAAGDGGAQRHGQPRRRRHRHSRCLVVQPRCQRAPSTGPARCSTTTRAPTSPRCRRCAATAS